jgi:hypothetical protein
MEIWHDEQEYYDQLEKIIDDILAKENQAEKKQEIASSNVKQIVLRKWVELIDDILKHVDIQLCHKDPLSIHDDLSNIKNYLEKYRENFLSEMK